MYKKRQLKMKLATHIACIFHNAQTFLKSIFCTCITYQFIVIKDKNVYLLFN